MPDWSQQFLAWLRSLGESRRVDIETFSQDWEKVTTRMLEENVKFRSLLEAAPDGMVIVDKTGRMVLVNSQTETMFGYPRQELLGRPIELLIPERYHQVYVRHRADYSSELGARPIGRGLDLYGRRRDATEFPVEIRLSPLQTGEDTLIISAIRDVTERKRVETQLKETARELKRSNEELEAFTYSASHDLMAPLRKLDSFGQILEKNYGDRLDAEGRDHLARMRSAAKGMAGLIDSLLELSRLGRHEMKRAPLNLSAMAESILEDLRKTAPARTVSATIAPGLTARGDEYLIRAVLANLLANAWKFTATRADAAIEFGAQNADGAAAYFIRDNGVGFDAAHADKLFRAFSRLHRPGEFPGSGIGLATVRRIVERHGGRTWAEAAVDRGAAFFFTLP